MKFKVLMILFIASISFGQNIDSIYNKIISVNNNTGFIPSKCSFHERIVLNNTYNKALLKDINARPQKQTYRDTPDGRFRIHYDTSGVSVPNFFGHPKDSLKEYNTIERSIDSLITILDKVYKFEIDYLGYIFPPSDGIAGGDEKYDIYISTSNFFGETVWEGNEHTPSYIILRNNFTTTNTKNLDAVKVTIAHEFHHAIQLGSYTRSKNGSINLSDSFFYESTSTSMEEFVYPDINDYLQYIDNYFFNPSKAFVNTDGYDKVIWNLFLVAKIGREKGDILEGHNFVKSIWEEIDNREDAISSFEKVSINKGYSLSSLFKEFGIWCYFTGGRAVEGKYFEDAKLFPQIKFSADVAYTPPQKEVSVFTQPMTNNYILFSTISGDSIVNIISNIDFESAKLKSNSSIKVNTTLSSTQINNNSLKISGNLFSTTEGNSLINNSLIVNNQTNNYISRETDFVYPLPFVYGKHNTIKFPVKNNFSEITSLAIYNVSMDLIFNKELKPVIDNDNRVIEWNALGNNGEKLASGVYIYVTKSGDDLIKGKLVILNE